MARSVAARASVGERRRDPGHMQPAGSVERAAGRRSVDISGCDARPGRPTSGVDDLGGAEDPALAEHQTGRRVGRRSRGRRPARPRPAAGVGWRRQSVPPRPGRCSFTGCPSRARPTATLASAPATKRSKVVASPSGPGAVATNAMRHSPRVTTWVIAPSRRARLRWPRRPAGRARGSRQSRPSRTASHPCPRRPLPPR